MEDRNYYEAEPEMTEDILEEEAAELLEESDEGFLEDSEDIGLEPASDDGAESGPGDPSVRKTIVGVRFRTAGKIYYFSPGELEVKKGDSVIVETARGVEFGTVISGPTELGSDRIPKQLRDILRIATQEDIDRERSNREKEKEAYKICLEKIAKHNPEMKLIGAEYTFDNSKILFYFTADGRVDFRDLVKDLANVFRTRIELRQIGVRDEAKLLGGYGICGRPLCCHTYLSDFVPVSIKMAKEQNLSLNPAKISGVCGRLMCCLKNEEDIYEELNKKLPKPGDEVEGNDGLRGEVASVNILRQTVRILVEVDDEKELHEYGDGEWTLIRKRKKGRSGKKKSSGAQGAQNGQGGTQNGSQNGGQSDRGAKDQKEPKEHRGRKEQEKAEGNDRKPRGPRKADK